MRIIRGKWYTDRKLQRRDAEELTQVQIWAAIAQAALNYIFISVISTSNQKQTVTDLKQDLRTTKEDLMSELKDTREAFLRESEISTKAIIDIVKAEVQKELKKNETDSFHN